ncbi:MAG: YggS family pyridoxal phosphate-dependent enzyme [Leptospiraceae bacterium]|nr:YggS family pyridoxal phosphate-dependent enzyme [Leptospiraceae bacterium]
MQSIDYATRLQNLRDQLATLGRPDVRIIAVSKTHGPEAIRSLLELGQRDFGENRQNEARDKFPLVALRDLIPEQQPIYHHIGPLQSGNARQIPGLFQYVHGVSDWKALDVLLKSAQKRIPRDYSSELPFLSYLIQVRLTDEAGKAGGMLPAEILNRNRFPENEAVSFRGFMCMGPENQDPIETRAVFQRLRAIRDGIDPTLELSMGMSGDWEIAVAEGATMIRVGTLLFGPRAGAPWHPQSEA